MQVNSKVTVIWLKPDQMFCHRTVALKVVIYHVGQSKDIQSTLEWPLDVVGWTDRWPLYSPFQNSDVRTDILTPPSLSISFSSFCYLQYLPNFSFSDRPRLLCSVIFPPHPHCVFPFILHNWNQRWWPSYSFMQDSLSLGIAGHKQAKETDGSCLLPYLNLA